MLQYRLELKAPGTLVVRLAEANSRRILYLDTLRALAQSADAPAVDLLTKLHLKARSGTPRDTLSFQEIELPPSVSNEAIRLMAKTGRLLYAGKPLAARAHKERLTFRGKATGIEATIPLTTLFPGSPPWVIHNGEWFELDTPLSWKWLELFTRGPVMLEGVAKKRFLEEEPSIVWETQTSTPRLMLTDPSGCFANLATPEWEQDLLDAGYQRKVVGTSQYYCPADQVAKVLRFLLELGWTCVDAQQRTLVRQSGYAAQLSERGDALRLRGLVQFGERTAPLARALAHKRPLLELDAEHVGLLDAAALPQLDGEWIGDALVKRRSHIGELLPLLEDTSVSWDAPLRAAADALQGGAGLEALALPQFRGELLPYQAQGVAWLEFLRSWGLSALLADEMGLGKTVQVLAFFSQLRTNLPLLIVAPTSLLFNWRAEIRRFWPEARVAESPGEGAQVVLTSYALLRRDVERLKSIEFEAIALDEANAIKNASSQTAEAACQLKGRFRIAITGTPVENAPEELWSQFRFLLPGLLGSKRDFQAAEPASSRRKVRPFILRRKKQDVQLQLPEKVDHPVWVEMTEPQQALYDRTLGALKSGLLTKVSLDGLAAHRMEVLEAILRLRQIALDPRLVGEELPGAKPERLGEDVVTLLQEGKKLLVFSQFTAMLQRVRADLRARGVEPLYFDGTLSSDEREATVRAFQERPEPCVLLLSLKAGGVGLNLTAAEHVILLDPWWNDAVERQAIDRAHRIGQRRTLFVQRYLSPGTIEEKMLHLKESKSAQSEELLSDEPLSWSTEDWLHLLS